MGSPRARPRSCLLPLVASHHQPTFLGKKRQKIEMPPSWEIIFLGGFADMYDGPLAFQNLGGVLGAPLALTMDVGKFISQRYGSRVPEK